MEGKLNVSQIVGIGTIDALDGRIGRVAEILTVATTLKDTHDLEGEVAYLDVLTYQRLVILRLQFFCHLVVEHEHLTLLLQVDVVDETSIEQFAFHNLRVNGEYARDLHVHIFLTIRHNRTDRVCGTHFIDGCLEFRVGGGEVTLIQPDVSSFAQAVVSLRGHTSVGLHRVRQEVVMLLDGGIDQTITCA